MKRSPRPSLPAKEAGPRYVFRLYVSGSTPRSTQAIRNIRKICEEYLTGRYDLEVVDIYQQPELAGEQQIIAAPTLIKSLPLPLRRFIGDLSQSEPVLVGIGLRAGGGAAP
jgi:circadian clock protein KaiB